MDISPVRHIASRRIRGGPAPIARALRPAHRTRITATAVAVLCLSLLPLSPALAASQGVPGSISLRVAGVPASASQILVEAESSLTHPGRLGLYVVAVVPVSGTSMTVTVPRSRRLSSIAAAQHGAVNLMVAAESSTRTWQKWVPVHLSPRGDTLAAVTGISQVSEKHAPRPMLNPAVARRQPLICLTKQLRSTEGVTRIGELHVGDLLGVAGQYSSTVTTDDTVSVGFSSTGDPGSFTADGSASVTDSVTGGGSFTRAGPYNQYVNGHIYYGKFELFGSTCLISFFVQATSSPGDAFPGTRQAPPNPYGSCHADPNGLVAVATGGTYLADTSQAKTYSGAFAWLGFSFSASDGFTRDVSERWFNRDTKNTFVCGNVNPVQDSHIFWNNTP